MFSRRRRLALGAIVFVFLFVIHQLTTSHGELPFNSSTPNGGLNGQGGIAGVPTFQHASSLAPLIAPPIALNVSKLALLIETRPIPHLIPLILHFISVVPPDWTFRMLGSVESLSFVNTSYAIQRHTHSGKLDLRVMPDKYAVTDTEAVSRTLTSISFYEDLILPAEHLLIFQPDSILCSNSPRSIEDFIQYDYVGAPWPNCDYGGNGGLSLRSVGRTIEVLKILPRPANHLDLEDNWISQKMKELPNPNVASSSVEKTFSVEMIYEEWPLGFHLGGDSGVSSLEHTIWKNKERRRKIYEYCPEIKIIMSMELVGRVGGFWKFVATMEKWWHKIF